MKKNETVYVAGHRGLVGSGLVRRLQSEGFDNLLLRTRSELDLCDQRAVSDFFAAEKPRYVFLAAAKVGGILANDTRPADFLRENLQIQTNVIEAAWRASRKELTNFCISGTWMRDATGAMHETTSAPSG